MSIRITDIQEEHQTDFSLFLHIMNYLAHAYLSFDKGDILVGNFMTDTLKGKSDGYNEQIRKGILLHRKIDEFTDDNKYFQTSMARIDCKFGLYAAIIIDMFYDHFLAANWYRYHDESLSHFAANVYKTMLAAYPILPVRMKRMLPFMVIGNWLDYYRNPGCFRHFFRGLSFRARHAHNLHDAAEEIFKHYDELDRDFSNFMDEIIPFVKKIQKN
ncbi:MAG TPA: acyl carrier protein phosphodiesterase [Bacteroidales bacterium]|nr:acyl carrier protein phosphodiesterase [Bacteroidales bacterium]